MSDTTGDSIVGSISPKGGRRRKRRLWLWAVSAVVVLVVAAGVYFVVLDSRTVSVLSISPAPDSALNALPVTVSCELSRYEPGRGAVAPERRRDARAGRGPGAADGAGSNQGEPLRRPAHGHHRLRLRRSVLAARGPHLELRRRHAGSRRERPFAFVVPPAEGKEQHRRIRSVGAGDRRSDPRWRSGPHRLGRRRGGGGEGHTGGRRGTARAGTHRHGPGG